MNLYEITNEAQAMIQELYGLEDVPEQVIIDTIESVELEVKDKQIAVASYILNLEHEVEGMEEYLKRMKGRLEKASKRIEYLKSYLYGSMKKMGFEKVKGIEFDIKITRNPPRVQFFNEGLIPADYIVEKKEYAFDRNRIKMDLKNNVEVPGCRLIQEETLRIDAGRPILNIESKDN